MAKAPYTARFGFTQAQITDAFGRWAAKTQGNTAYALFQDYGPGIDAGTSRFYILSPGLVDDRVPILECTN